MSSGRAVEGGNAGPRVVRTRTRAANHDCSDVSSPLQPHPLSGASPQHGMEPTPSSARCCRPRRETSLLGMDCKHLPAAAPEALLLRLDRILVEQRFQEFLGYQDNRGRERHRRTCRFRLNVGADPELCRILQQWVADDLCACAEPILQCANGCSATPKGTRHEDACWELALGLADPEHRKVEERAPFDVQLICARGSSSPGARDSVPLHRDYAPATTKTLEGSCCIAVSVLLHDVAPENGFLQVYSGTRHMCIPQEPTAANDPREASYDTRSLRRNFMRMVERGDFRPYDFTGKRGDVLLFDGALLHRVLPGAYGKWRHVLLFDLTTSRQIPLSAGSSRDTFNPLVGSDWSKSGVTLVPREWWSKQEEEWDCEVDSDSNDGHHVTGSNGCLDGHLNSHDGFSKSDDAIDQDDAHAESDEAPGAQAVTREPVLNPSGAPDHGLPQSQAMPPPPAPVASSSSGNSLEVAPASHAPALVKSIDPFIAHNKDTFLQYVGCNREAWSTFRSVDCHGFVVGGSLGATECDQLTTFLRANWSKEGLLDPDATHQRVKVHGFRNYPSTWKDLDNASQQQNTLSIEGATYKWALRQNCFLQLVGRVVDLVWRRFHETCAVLYAHVLRQSSRTVDSTYFTTHRDTEQNHQILFTVIVKLTPDLVGEPRSQMRVLGATPFSYGPGTGSFALFLSDMWHESIPPLSTREHMKVAFFLYRRPSA